MIAHMMAFACMRVRHLVLGKESTINLFQTERREYERI